VRTWNDGVQEYSVESYSMRLWHGTGKGGGRVYLEQVVCEQAQENQRMLAIGRRYKVRCPVTQTRVEDQGSLSMLLPGWWLCPVVVQNCGGLIFGAENVTTGASNDFMQVRGSACALVAFFSRGGTDPLGAVNGFCFAWYTLFSTDVAFACVTNTQVSQCLTWLSRVLVCTLSLNTLFFVF